MIECIYTTLVYFILLIILFIFSRTIYIFLIIHIPKLRVKVKRDQNDSCLTTIVMGSGGHTGEMMLLLEKLSDKYHPRWYLVGHDDHRSRSKVHDYEKRHGGIFQKDYFVYEIQRARKVGQSIPSSIISTLRSILDAFIWIIYMIKSPPELILCNGPAICIPVALVGYFSKIFYGVWSKYPTRIVYVESFARVNSLSVTGKILYWIADGFIIQWPTTCKGFASDPLYKSVYFGSPII